MKRKRLSNLYKLETELCETLIKYAEANNYVAYPETSGWDILLVKDKFQIGVQAKLKDGVEVLAQAIKQKGNAPHIRAVLVPQASHTFRDIAYALNIFVIEALAQEWVYHPGYKATKETLKKINIDLDSIPKKFHVEPTGMCWVPEVKINTPAGVKSPKVITEWKLKAVKLCLKLRKRGYLTSKDFKEEKVSMSIWKSKWLWNNDKIVDGLMTWKAAPKAVLPDELYPEIVEAFKKANKE